MTDTNDEHPAAETAATLDDSVEAALEFVKRQWRENPAAVVAAAAGAGFLLGLLLGGRRR